jgi:hypothetical protein
MQNDPVLRKLCLEECEVPLPLVTYRNILTDDENLSAQRVDQNTLDELLGRNLRKELCEMDSVEELNSKLPESFALLSQTAQCPRLSIPAQDTHRMGIKGHHCRGEPLGDLSQTMKHVAMSKMDTIKIAKRNDTTPEVLRHLGRKAK